MDMVQDCFHVDALPTSAAQLTSCGWNHLQSPEHWIILYLWYQVKGLIMLSMQPSITPSFHSHSLHKTHCTDPNISHDTCQPEEQTKPSVKEVVAYKSVCMFCKDYPCLKSDNDSQSMVRCDKCNTWLHCHCVGISSEKVSNSGKFYCCEPVRPEDDLMWAYFFELGNNNVNILLQCRYTLTEL